jgi:lipopolysaccharide transport system ATP-binding protein
MSLPAIRVENLSKCYRIGAREGRQKNFREALVDSVMGPLKNFKRLRNMTTAQRIDRAEGGDPIIWALRDVSFDIEEGTILGVIGHNGAGKTTLLKILSRITEPTAGEAMIYGRISSLLEVGTGFHPELTGRENVYLNGTIMGMKKREIDRKFDEIVAFADVDKFLDTPVKRYSSGMYVRLAFAVAAHLDPEILLIDEVLAVGDAAFQRKCLGKMDNFAQQGRTVLFVSHNMAAVQQLCNGALLFKDGRLEMNSDVRTAVARYLADDAEDRSSEDELFHRPRQQGMGEQVRITGCKVRDAPGRENYDLKFGEPFSVEIECKGLTDVNNASFVIGIDSIFGGRIATSLSEEADQRVSVKKNGRASGRLTINHLMLKPGRYFITISVKGIKGGLDQIERARSFTVTPSLFDEDKVPNSKWGLIYVEPLWSISVEDRTMGEEG